MTTDDEAGLDQMTAEDWGNPITAEPPRERRSRAKPVAPALDEDADELRPPPGEPPGQVPAAGPAPAAAQVPAAGPGEVPEPSRVSEAPAAPARTPVYATSSFVAPSSLTPPSDADDWENAARAFHRDRLQNARRTAERWIAGVMSLLALFGSIAIVAVPTGIDRISNSGIRWAVLAFTALAGTAAAVSLGMGTMASHTSIRPGTSWDGEQYRSYVDREVHAVARRLLLARVSGFVAAALLFTGGGVLLAAGAARSGTPGSAPSVLVVRKSGQLACGPLATEGSAVTVGGRRISDVVSITVVAAC